MHLFKPQSQLAVRLWCTCVCYIRVLPDVATVADRSFNNRVEVIESAT